MNTPSIGMVVESRTLSRMGNLQNNSSEKRRHTVIPLQPKPQHLVRTLQVEETNDQPQIKQDTTQIKQVECGPYAIRHPEELLAASRGEQIARATTKGVPGAFDAPTESRATTRIDTVLIRSFTSAGEGMHGNMLQEINAVVKLLNTTLVELDIQSKRQVMMDALEDTLIKLGNPGTPDHMECAHDAHILASVIAAVGAEWSDADSKLLARNLQVFLRTLNLNLVDFVLL